MSFGKKHIDITFMLDKGDFGQKGYDIIKFTGLRVHTRIEQSGGEFMGKAEATIFGLTQSHMNQMSHLARITDDRIEIRLDNKIRIEAGDEYSNNVIFEGNTVMAPIDMSGAPSNAIRIMANAGGFESFKRVAPASYPGQADAAIVIKKIAEDNGYKFEGNDVSIKLSTPYYPGTPLEQIRRCAEAADINWTIDRGIVAIWRKGGYRNLAETIVSPETGMVGYPVVLNWNGISIKTEFNPNIQFGMNVSVTSSMPYASGKFYTQKVAHEIESETPGGAWFTYFDGYSNA